jgi:histidinol-phosphatase
MSGQPTAEFLDTALEVAKRAASAAAEVINRYYRGQFEVITKADESPVTRADIESEQAIRAVLSAAYPEHAIYGEEEGTTGSGDWLWLVDPIDGTKSFVRGYPMFSTQIALMYRGELVLGVSSAPAAGELAWARRGGGAFLDGKSISVAQPQALEKSAISFGNLKTLAAAPGWHVLSDFVRRASRSRGYGDYYHYHLLARGGIDLVIESDVNILDIAALAVIVREAGGVFTDLDGAELGLQTRTVLAGNPELHAQALSAFRGWAG